MVIKPVSRARGYDAIVIGTGLGGSTLAYRLAQRGMHVLFWRKGDVLQLRPHQLGEPVGINVKSFPALAAKEMSFPHGLNVVGGQTKFYGAFMYRMRESHFLGIPHEAGVSPSAGLSQPTILNHTTVRQSEFTAYTARAKATLPSLPQVSLFHIPLCRTRRWWDPSGFGYVSPALLY